MNKLCKDCEHCGKSTSEHLFCTRPISSLLTGIENIWEFCSNERKEGFDKCGIDAKYFESRKPRLSFLDKLKGLFG